MVTSTPWLPRIRSGEVRHVGEARHVGQRQLVLGEERGDHQRQRGILGARDRDFAVQFVAADQTNTVHSGDPRRKTLGRDGSVPEGVSYPNRQRASTQHGPAHPGRVQYQIVVYQGLSRLGPSPALSGASDFRGALRPIGPGVVRHGAHQVLGGAWQSYSRFRGIGTTARKAAALCLVVTGCAPLPGDPPHATASFFALQRPPPCGSRPPRNAAGLASKPSRKLQ
jgi:hypothetical protein